MRAWSAVSRLAQARSVVWLKCSQPCLHHFHVLSTVFSCRPLSSFSLWIILLLSDSRCFLLFGQAIFFLHCLWICWDLCNRCFFVFVSGLRVLAGHLSLHLAMGFAWVFRLPPHGSKVQQLLGGSVFMRRNDCGFVFSCLVVKRLTDLAVHELSSLAVHEIASQAVHELSS